jgi:hypothetical protein
MHEAQRYPCGVLKKHPPTCWKRYFANLEEIQEYSTYNPTITMHKDDGGLNRS